TVADLKTFSEAELYEELGKWGLELYEKIRGRDESPLVLEWTAKSIGEQETFPEDTDQFSYIKERADELCESVIATLKRDGFDSFRRVVLTMRFDNFKTKNRSRTLKEPAGSVEILKREILNLLMPFFDRRENPDKRKYRLIGVRVEELGKSD
ncbi:MAG TPA: hypothetical protein VFK07_02690, partial [Candidatus Paceibacterota bacterium]|nr:hypothetical protein [Candidatus Paceibacterota bacterium]